MRCPGLSTTFIHPTQAQPPACELPSPAMPPPWSVAGINLPNHESNLRAATSTGSSDRRHNFRQVIRRRSHRRASGVDSPCGIIARHPLQGSLRPPAPSTPENCFAVLADDDATDTVAFHPNEPQDLSKRSSQSLPLQAPASTP